MSSHLFALVQNHIKLLLCLSQGHHDNAPQGQSAGSSEDQSSEGADDEDDDPQLREEIRARMKREKEGKKDMGGSWSGTQSWEMDDDYSQSNDDDFVEHNNEGHGDNCMICD